MYFSVEFKTVVGNLKGKAMFEMQANEGEPSLPLDIFSHVFELVQKGNRAFRENRFEEVTFYHVFSIYKF